MSWTEAEIQNRLAGIFNKSSLCIPNCGVFGWESDLIRVTPRLFSAEYEIKSSRADFRCDLRDHGPKKWRRNCLEEAETRRIAGRPMPNFFWYVTPPGVVPVDLVPEFAGLAELADYGPLVVVKKAPRLHKLPLTPRDVLFITRGVALRYWQQR